MIVVERDGIAALEAGVVLPTQGVLRCQPRGCEQRLVVVARRLGRVELAACRRMVVSQLPAHCAAAALDSVDRIGVASRQQDVSLTGVAHRGVEVERVAVIHIEGSVIRTAGRTDRGTAQERLAGREVMVVVGVPRPHQPAAGIELLDDTVDDVDIGM